MNSHAPKPIILSADDDENAHILLKHALRRAGIEANVQLVNDGSEVIEYLQGEGRFSDRSAFPFPDLLLLDLKMPKVSGFGVLDFIRKHPPTKTFPVVLFSSSDVAQDVETAHSLGCSAYVLKPGSFEQLLEFVTALAAEFFPSEKTNSVQRRFSEFKLFPQQKPAMTKAAKLGPDALASQSESPDVLRLLVEQVKDYAIFMLDKEGFVLSWNEGARRINGYDAKEIIGRNFATFYPQPDRDNEKPQFELRMAQEMGRYEEDGWRLRKDGSKFWANVVSTRLLDSDGKFIGFAQVIRDLTQRRIQEDSIQKVLDSEERFRLLVDQVKDYAIFILDARGNIASWNQGARRLKGYSADEVMGKHFSMFYTSEDIARDHPAHELSLAIRDGRYEEEGWRVKKDGSRFWANVVITSLWDKRGNLTGFAKVTRDLTQRKRQDDALRRKTEELESFAHTVSHDLRTPLRAISGYASILHRDATNLDEVEKHHVEKIIKSAQTMEMLITDILKLSEMSVAPMVEESVPLEEVIEQSLALQEQDLAKTKAWLEVHKPLPNVKGNRTFLVQVFSNLLSNALKFVPKDRKARVEIFADTTHGSCDIHVKDNGIGIPKDLRESIFKIFDRGAADRTISGTGVGLAIVKRAIERLGGNITVESKEGEGSDFIVSLVCDHPTPHQVEEVTQ